MTNVMTNWYITF